MDSDEEQPRAPASSAAAFPEVPAVVRKLATPPEAVVVTQAPAPAAVDMKIGARSPLTYLPKTPGGHYQAPSPNRSYVESPDIVVPVSPEVITRKANPVQASPLSSAAKQTESTAEPTVTSQGIASGGGRLAAMRMKKASFRHDMRHISEDDGEESAALVTQPRVPALATTSPAAYTPSIAVRQLVFGPESARPDAWMDTARFGVPSPGALPSGRIARQQVNMGPTDTVLNSPEEEAASPASPLPLGPIRRIPSALFARSSAPVLTERSPSMRSLAPLRAPSRSRARGEQDAPDTSLQILDM
jgi:hypothetical protein